MGVRSRLLPGKPSGDIYIAFMFIYMCVYIHIYICVCMYVYACIYLCVYYISVYLYTLYTQGEPTQRHRQRTTTRHTRIRQEQHPRPPNEHPPQTLNNARRWRDDGACHLPRYTYIVFMCVFVHVCVLDIGVLIYIYSM